MSRTLRVPIFPLPGSILFPRTQLPLHIFEPRYREMVRDAVDGVGQIAMTPIRRRSLALAVLARWSGSRSSTADGSTLS